MEGAWVTQQQIEAARVAMTRYMKRGGKVWINIFPHLSLTKIPLETRMGKGKGQPEKWVAVVKKGKIMFEIGGVEEAVAREALRLAMHKLPIKCKFVMIAILCHLYPFGSHVAGSLHIFCLHILLSKHTSQFSVTCNPHDCLD